MSPHYRTSSDEGAITVLMREYDGLVREKHLRMEHRVKMIAFNLTFAGALFGAALYGHEVVLFLLAPIFSSLFGLDTISQIRDIHNIGHHVRTRLGSRIHDVSGGGILIWDCNNPVLAAEITHGEGPPENQLDVFLDDFFNFHLPNVGAFLLPGVFGVMLYWLKTPCHDDVTGIVLTAAGVACLSGFMCAYCLYMRMIRRSYKALS